MFSFPREFSHQPRSLLRLLSPGIKHNNCGLNRVGWEGIIFRWETSMWQTGIRQCLTVWPWANDLTYFMPYSIASEDTHTHTYTHTHINACAHVRMHTHINTDMRKHTHTHTHTTIRMKWRLPEMCRTENQKKHTYFRPPPFPLPVHVHRKSFSSGKLFTHSSICPRNPWEKSSLFPASKNIYPGKPIEWRWGG